MFKHLKERLAIQKRITEMVLEEERKRKAYKTLIDCNLNYSIIQDLINSARRGVEIAITLRDGTALRITQNEPIDTRSLVEKYRDLY